MLLYVASAGHVRAAEARPHRLGGVAVHAVPFLRIQDRVVLREPQSTHVLTPVHHSHSHALHMTVARAASRTSTSCQGMLHLMGWMKGWVRYKLWFEVHTFLNMRLTTDVILNTCSTFKRPSLLGQGFNDTILYQASYKHYSGGVFNLT